MKKLLTFVLLTGALAATADTPKYLTLHGNGEATSYSISDIRKITFGKQTANNLEVHLKSKSTVDKYPYSTLEKGTFEVESSGIEDVLADNGDLSISYNMMTQEATITSSSEIISVIICNLDGVVIDMLSPATTNAAISLAEQSQGMYIVKAVTATDAKTVKIVKH